MGRYLNQASSFRQVDRCITDLGEEDGVELGIMLESRKDSQSFTFWRPAVNKRLAQLFGVRLFCPRVSKSNQIKFIKNILLLANKEPKLTSSANTLSENTITLSPLLS